MPRMTGSFRADELLSGPGERGVSVISAIIGYRRLIWKSSSGSTVPRRVRVRLASALLAELELTQESPLRR